MYRKHIRMSQIKASESTTGFNSRFIQHVASYTAVYVAWTLAFSIYKKAKSSSKVLNKSLTTVENAALFVTKTAEPLVKKIEPQIKTLDSLALRGIENIEEIIPNITRQSGKVIIYTKSKYDEMVESGLRKYDVVKQTAATTAKEVSDISVQKSNEYLNTPSGQLLLAAFNGVFDAYEMYLDHVLPPLGDERPDAVFGDTERPPVLDRADMLTERFKERFYKHTLLFLQNVKIRGKIRLAKIYHMNVINFEITRA